MRLPSFVKYLPFGALIARKLQSATRTRELPGAPAGEYEVLVFQTDFANRRGAIETVTLTREQTGWRTTGYYIR